MYDLDSQNEQKDLDIDSFGTMDVRKTLIIIRSGCSFSWYGSWFC